MENPSCDIDTLYDRYSRRLYHTSLRIVGNAMDAEEVMHDTLLKLVRQTQLPPTVPQIEAWLVKTCVRGSIDRIRSRKKGVLSFSDLGPGADPKVVADNEAGWSDFLCDASIETADKIRKIRTAVEALPDRYRLIFTLFMLDGYDHAEISDITGLKGSTVRSVYARAKVKLLEILLRNG